MINIDTLTIFILACFVGYYVVSKVTPALHAPLMSVTNAISSVIIVAAFGYVIMSLTGFCVCIGIPCIIISLIAIFLASINIVGGFMITKRMLSMFLSKKKEK